ncbi:hypothetical protein F528_2468 [Neisseria meningitidis 992008]|nr:hypothetical protein F528_2468 [Neisseria meningitidis 992008]
MDNAPFSKQMPSESIKYPLRTAFLYTYPHPKLYSGLTKTSTALPYLVLIFVSPL